MTYRTNIKDVKNSYEKVISVNYCGLQNLLRFESPVAYTSGVYGWNADIYEFNNIAIVTGYRPFGKRINYDILRKYEKKAEQINCNYSLSWETTKKLINHLLIEFLKELY